MKSGVLSAVLGGLVLLGVLAFPSFLEGQDPRMNFFLSPGGPGGDQFGAVIMSDSYCHDLGYEAGFGDYQWKAYLDGTAEDGEEGEVAVERIGSGPWYNSAGEMIAENLDELHSPDGNFHRGTALTLHGEAAPEDFPLALGAELNGAAYSRAGPLLCFGVR
jgi:hypothetical protein